MSLMTRDESAMTLSVSLWLVDGGAPRALPSSSSELPELLKVERVPIQLPIQLLCHLNSGYADSLCLNT